MKIHPLPLVILAGSDPHPAELPESGAGLHPLKGYKGMDLKIKGLPLIDLLLECLQASGHFNPIFIAGPKKLYGAARHGAVVIDTDLNFGKNIEQSVTAVRASCGSGLMALITCDILPKVNELHRLMDDYYQNTPLDFWFPVILAPEKPQQIGASFWKPRYRVVPEPGKPARTLLPGHLIVVDTDALRLPLVYRTFDLAYRTRNRPILYRLGLIVSHIFLGLVVRDIRNVMTLRLPTLTYTVIYNGIALALRLRKGVITSDELADRLHNIFVMYRHRRCYPNRKGRLPLMHGLSFAKDIDTEEEAQEITDRFG